MRSPNFKPLDVFDCGSTSLHIVAKYNGEEYSSEMLHRHCFISNQGVNMLSISEGARYIGFDTVGVKLTFVQLVE